MARSRNQIFLHKTLSLFTVILLPPELPPFCQPYPHSWKKNSSFMFFMVARRMNSWPVLKYKTTPKATMIWVITHLSGLIEKDNQGVYLKKKKKRKLDGGLAERCLPLRRLPLSSSENSRAQPMLEQTLPQHASYRRGSWSESRRLTSIPAQS